jgi:hypothetical protein
MTSYAWSGLNEAMNGASEQRLSTRGGGRHEARMGATDDCYPRRQAGRHGRAHLRHDEGLAMSRYSALARDKPAGLEVHESGAVGALVLRQIALSVVFGSSGQLVSIDDLTGGSRVKRAVNRMLVPRILEGPKTNFSNFLWDRSRFALGVRRTRAPLSNCCFVYWAFHNFRSLHQRVLSDTSDVAVQSFLKFLDNWSPETIESIDIFGDKLDLNVVFRFQYDDDFLHNQPSARAIWKRLGGEKEILDFNLVERRHTTPAP